MRRTVSHGASGIRSKTTTTLDDLDSDDDVALYCLPKKSRSTEEKNSKITGAGRNGGNKDQQTKYQNNEE